MAQGTSELWKTLWGMKNTKREYGFDINGTWYGPESEVSHSVSSGLYEDFGIGNATAAHLVLKIYANGIPYGATIKRYIRLKNKDQVSEWLPKGVFFTNRRPEDDGLWNIEAYDAMRKAEAVWVPDQSLVFPLSMPAAVAEFCRILGVELDSRTKLNADYTIDYPANDATIRNELCWIAAAHGGNFVISDAGKLLLVPLVPDTEAAHDVGLDITGFENNGKSLPISRVTLRVDGENYYSAGNDTGIEITAECPHATQEMVDSLFNALNGYEYQMYSASDANIDPAAELGDGISVEDITSVIVRIDDDGSGYISVSAPGEEELEDEYPTAGPMTQQTNRKLAQIRSSIEKTAEEINLKIEATDGRVSQIDQTVGSISLSVTSSTSADGQTTARITLKVGPNSYSGYITLDGNVDVSGQLSADALYAALGEVADLSVDRLSTSRRIALYLAGDTSDDNYIRISGQTLEFITGSTDGVTTEQATNPNGALLYWEADVSGAELDALGYPYVDGVRIYTTTTKTAWPVYVYSYTEHVKRSMTFVWDDESGQYLPIDIYGTGYGKTDPDMGRGFLQKKKTSFDLWFHSITGEDLGIFIGEQYTDIVGLRKTKSLDFSRWDAGSFTEVVDGNLTEEYSVKFDDQGRPVRITDGDGHETTVSWGET